MDVHNQLRQYSLHLEKKWVTSKPYFRLHTTLVGINVIDTYRLSHFHSIFSSNKAIGFRRIYNDLTVETPLSPNDESHLCRPNFDESKNHYTIRAFAGVLAQQLIHYIQDDIVCQCLHTTQVCSRNTHFDVVVADNDSSSNYSMVT